MTVTFIGLGVLLGLGSITCAPNGPVLLSNPKVNMAALEKELNPNGAAPPCRTNDSDRIGSFSGNPSESSRWRNGYTVQIAPEFSAQQAQLIQGALYEIRTKICISIRKWPTGAVASGDYVYIQKGAAKSGCYSTSIGRLGGRQIINLEDPGCVTKGIVMHENIHAMGFNHEQTRPDRDQYITVYTNEIEDGSPQYQYKIYSGSLTFGVGYDTSSIMHYGSYDFTKNGNPTMRKKDGSIITKQRNGLTNNDIAKLKKMYNCP